MHHLREVSFDSLAEPASSTAGGHRLGAVERLDLRLFVHPQQQVSLGRVRRSPSPSKQPCPAGRADTCSCFSSTRLYTQNVRCVRLPFVRRLMRSGTGDGRHGSARTHRPARRRSFERVPKPLAIATRCPTEPA